MKLSISAAISFLFVTFTCIFFVNILNFTMGIQKMNTYHYATVHEIESSDFSPYVIASRVQDNTYDCEIIEKSVKEELRIYEVKTSTTLRIPILNYETQYIKESIAR